MLEHPGTGKRPFFRDMADKNKRRARGLRETRKPGRAFAHLGDRARRGIEFRGENRLDRVDHDEVRFLRHDHLFDRLKLNFTHQPDPVRTELKTLRAHRDLSRAFFTGYIECFHAAPDEPRRDLKEKRGFPDTRITADQRYASGHKSSAHHAVKFAEPGQNPRKVLCLNAGEILHFSRLNNRLAAVAVRAIAGADTLLHLIFGECVPGVAVRALSHPFWETLPALAANINRF